MPAELRGARVQVFVSDPWAFGSACGTGPFEGTVVEALPGGLTIRLGAPIHYEGRELHMVIARPRHAGVGFDELGAHQVPANLMLTIAVEPASGGFIPPLGGVSAIGSVGAA